MSNKIQNFKFFCKMSLPLDPNSQRLECLFIYCIKAVMGKLRPAGQLRPNERAYPARLNHLFGYAIFNLNFCISRQLHSYLCYVWFWHQFLPPPLEDSILRSKHIFNDVTVVLLFLCWMFITCLPGLCHLNEGKFERSRAFLPSPACASYVMNVLTRCRQELKNMLTVRFLVIR